MVAGSEYTQDGGQVRSDLARSDQVKSDQVWAFTRDGRGGCCKAGCGHRDSTIKQPKLETSLLGLYGHSGRQQQDFKADE